MGAEEVEAVAASGTRICALATGVTPDRVTTDGLDACPRAIRTVLGKRVRYRTSKYLNKPRQYLSDRRW
jgi:hypothetical protein